MARKGNVTAANKFPKIHNAMWPGLVGKGPGSEPFLDLETMLDLTCEAEIDGEHFDGVDLFLAAPHVPIDASEVEVRRLAKNLSARSLAIGSLVAPVWPATGGGSAMGGEEERSLFLSQIEKACRIGSVLRETGVRRYGVIRIDSATPTSDWVKDPERSTCKISETFQRACDIAEQHGERLAAEGEICWGGMHSWRKMLNLLEAVDRPQTLGFQADMAHTLLYALGHNAPEDRLLPDNYNWQDPAPLNSALETITAALRPWTIDFHVAQNDGTVKGAGSHDKTGHHCLPGDPHGKLDIVKAAGMWLRNGSGTLTKRVKHICWDGCMFPNSTMQAPETWKQILSTMIAVRDAHGWSE